MRHTLYKLMGVTITICACWLIQDPAFAAQDLKKLSGGIGEQIKAVANLLVIISYVAGVGFALAGVVQFKTHKDNPQQTPLSKPIVYLIVGACLLFLPTIMETAGQSVFSGEQKSGASGKVDLK